MGLETPSPSPTPQPSAPSLPESEPEVIIAPAEAQNLSAREFGDIIDAIGFNTPEQYDEAEEVEEEGGEENTESLTDFEQSPFLADAIERVRTEIPPLTPDEQAAIAAAVSGNQVSTAVEDLSQALREQTEEIASVPPSIESNAIAPAPFIQPNSPTLLIDDSTSRFSGTEWYNEIQKQRIIIAGCGGIGSNLAFQLARMHPASMVLYDDDSVEMVNMAGQLYSRNDLGSTKVSAITNMISLYTSAQNIYGIAEKFTPETEPGDVMMCGFDNMEARKTFFESWLGVVSNKPIGEERKCLFLDGRLSIDTLQIFCISGEDNYNIDRYENTFLFSDREADHTVCSMKQTTYLACMIGSLMTNLFTNWVANSLNPIVPYDLPFFTEYDAQNMIFRTER